MIDPAYTQALLDAARADLGKGEIPPGSNMGPYVEMLGAPFGLVPPFFYCASAVAHWLQVAQDVTGISKPVAGSSLSLLYVPQFESAGLWVPIETLRKELSAGRRPGPGAILIFTRERAGSKRSGHAGLLESYRGQTPVDIEANHSSTVERVDRSWSDPTLLGVGLVGGWQDSVPLIVPTPAAQEGASALVLVVGFAAGWAAVRHLMKK